MLVSLLALAGVAAFAAMVVPHLATTALTPRSDRTAAEAPAPPATTAKYAAGRSVVLDADGTGHFFGTFRINGRSERGLRCEMEVRGDPPREMAGVVATVKFTCCLSHGASGKRTAEAIRLRLNA